MEKDRRQEVQSVARAGAVLDALSSKAPMTAREVGDAAGIDRTVAYRLLRTLEGEHLVEARGAGWHLGAGALKLGMAYLDGLPFASIAPAFAIDLHGRVVQANPWLVSLAVPIDDRVVLIDRFWSRDSPLNSILSIGTLFPMDESATGHAILSCWSRETSVTHIGESRLAAIADTLEEVRSNGGLAFARETLLPGVSAIAAAVLDRQGDPVGAINISGIQLDAHLHLHSEVAQHVKRSASGISAAM